MRHTIHFVEGDAEDVLVETSGRGTLSGFLRFANDLISDPRFRPGMTILVDHARLDASRLSAADAGVFASVVDDFGERVRGSAIACVAPAEFMYGISRAFEAYAERTGVRTRVFRTLDEARAWCAAEKRAR